MAILFLIYMLVCFKTGLPLYWYDWLILVFLELYSLVSMLYSNSIKEAYERGFNEGHGPVEAGDNIFSDV